MSRRPSLNDPDFVEKHSAWTIERVRERFESTNEIRSILRSGGDSDPLPSQVEGLVRNYAAAIWAHHHENQETCREELRAAYEAAETLEDSEERMFEVLTAGCLAHKLGEKPLAREILLEYTKVPESDEYYLAASLYGLKPMHALAAVMSNAELKPLVARWQKSEFPSEIGTFPAALAERGVRFLTWEGVAPDTAFSSMSATALLVRNVTQRLPGRAVIAVAVMLMIMAWPRSFIEPANDAG